MVARTLVVGARPHDMGRPSDVHASEPHPSDRLDSLEAGDDDQDASRASDGPRLDVG